MFAQFYYFARTGHVRDVPAMLSRVHQYFVDNKIHGGRGVGLHPAIQGDMGVDFGGLEWNGGVYRESVI